MKSNNLDYLALVQDISKLLESDFVEDMVWSDPDQDGEYTQEEAREMAQLLTTVWRLSHYWYCTGCGGSSKYAVEKEDK